jgi:exosortase
MPTSVASPPAGLLLPSVSTGIRVATAALLASVLYFDVAVDLVESWWNDPALSQGLLIPPLALFIAWIRRGITLAVPAEADNRGLALIALSSVLFLIGRLAAEFFLSRIAIVVLLAGFVWTFWGWRRLRTLSFPLLLLATMVPIPNLIYNLVATRLQIFASDMATTLSQAAGVSTYRDGNVIHLAHLSLGVEEACSGLNSLSALMVAALLLGYMNLRGANSRILLFLLSFPLSILVNVVRITGTAVLADYHEEFAMGFYHSFSGWLIFIVGYGLLAAIGKGLSSLLEKEKGRVTA